MIDLVRILTHYETIFSMQLNGNLDSSRYEWIPSLLGPLLAASAARLVLDIGAGDGRMKATVENAGGTYRGFDLFPSRSEINRWDLDEAPDHSWPQAGGALLLDVIEHCNNPGLALRHIAGALLPGAFLVLTTPNPRWSRSRLFALASGDLACFTPSDLDLNHHVFTPWPHILEKLLGDAGFSVEQYATLEGKAKWPGAPFNLRYPVRLGVAMAMKTIERYDSSACGMSFGLVARKTA